MKRALYFSILILTYIFVTGMGSLRGSGDVMVPEPETNYKVTLTDQADVSTELEEFTCEGQVYLTGKRGEAHVSIGFDKISSIRFFREKDGLIGEVHLKDGKVIPLKLEKDMCCYGMFAYGKLKIAMKDIKSIIVHGVVSTEEE
nr:hypothetical protein [Desulfobacterales bacterium]